VSRHRVRLVVNGRACEVVVAADRLLIDVLRDDLALTGTKEGCGVGTCGLCSVLIDGALMSGCLVLAVVLDGASVETIEGLSEMDGPLSPIQDAFIRHGGFQCGICTPGQIVAASALLREQARPTEGEIRRWMMGNLCRCTGYEGIIEAISSVSSGAER
jgi:aerobic-type carbon monoxide dehydrogenase small subunit (CoxS/CutS family)